MLSNIEIIMFITILIFCVVSLLWIAFKSILLLGELWQLFIKKCCPRLYYYDWDEEI